MHIVAAVVFDFNEPRILHRVHNGCEVLEVCCPIAAPVVAAADECYVVVSILDAHHPIKTKKPVAGLLAGNFLLRLVDGRRHHLVCLGIF